MSGLKRDGTTEPVSRDQILRRERGQGNIHFACSADHEQDWQPYPVDPYCGKCLPYINTCMKWNRLFGSVLLLVGVDLPEAVGYIQESS